MVRVGKVKMQQVADLEKSIAILLEQYRALKLNNRQLQLEKLGWQEERQRLVERIEGILEGLDDVDVEGL